MNFLGLSQHFRRFFRSDYLFRRELSVHSGQPFNVQSYLRVIRIFRFVAVAERKPVAVILNAQIEIQRMNRKLTGNWIVRFKIFSGVHIHKAILCGNHDGVEVIGFPNIREVDIRVLVLFERQSKQVDQFAHPRSACHGVPGVGQRRRFR